MAAWSFSRLAAGLSFVLIASCGGSERGGGDADAPDMAVPDADLPDPTECLDHDGDTLEARYYKETGEPVAGSDPCPREDCNDSNPRQGSPGAERCDEYDNDCDGEVDEGVRVSGHDCMGSAINELGQDGDDWGVDDEGNPDDPDVRARGIEVDDDGALRLISERRIRDFIWMADTGHQYHSISKYSTQAPYRLEGRYCLNGPETGGTEAQPCGNADPSRTSVNLFGDVYVGDRANGRVIKILGAGIECPDRNGDGIVNTWVPDGDEDPLNDPPPLPWLSDECVDWVTDIQKAGGADARGIAAQEVEGPDGEIEQFVWVGGAGGNTVFKLRGTDGEILISTAAPTGMYGMALDGYGNLWMTNAGRLGRLDTTRCLTDEECDAFEICRTGTADDDNCIKQEVLNVPCGSYGITVDFKSRIWLGGSGMSRYDPRADIGHRWAAVPAGGDGFGFPGSGGGCSGDLCEEEVECGSYFTHGVAADGNGFVWGATSSTGVIRANADAPAEWTVVAGTSNTDCTAEAVPGIAQECDSKGMAVDLFGKIWAINMGDTAMVISPGVAIDDNVVTHGVAPFPSANRYTYSDMTGIQLRLATNSAGYYQRLFQPCGDNPNVTNFDTLDVELEAPSGTLIEWEIRVANTVDGLNDAEWISAGESTRDEQIPVGVLLAENGVEGRVLEIRARFRSNIRSVREVVSPLLQQVSLTSMCEIEFM